MSSQEAPRAVKVPKTGGGGDSSRGAGDSRLTVNLSPADITGTESGPWEWFAAWSSRVIARFFRGLIKFFKRR
jgi:hypothetical protein